MNSCFDTGYLRLLLMGIIAVFAVMLLGADYPEHGQQETAVSVIAQELCLELSPEIRSGMMASAVKDPVRVIQLIAE